jgi:hypothetical protein
MWGSSARRIERIIKKKNVPTNAFGCINVILLHSNHRRVLGTCGHTCDPFEGGEDKIQIAIVKCRYHFTAENYIIFG